MNWVDSAQDGDYGRALVNAALDLRVPQAMELVVYTEERMSNNTNFLP